MSKSRLSVLFICASLMCQLVDHSKAQSGTNRSPFKSSFFFAGRTVYENIRGTLIPPLLYTNCEPVRFWTLQRHATRSPDVHEKKTISALLHLKHQVIKNHEEGRGYLTDASIRRIRSWSFDNATEANALSDVGWDETIDLAKRLKTTFPSFSLKGKTDDQYFFRHSDTQRTRRTAQAYIDGLFEDGAHKYVKTYAAKKDQDVLLYPFAKACPELDRRLSNISSYADENNFLLTDPYKRVIKRVSKRIGFEEPLTHETINAIYLSCAYDTAEGQQTRTQGAWCSAMTLLDILTIEYFWDLHFNTIAGYHNDHNKFIACGLVKDLWRRFRSVRANRGRILAGHFTHDGLLMFLHHSLGLLRDKVPVTSANFHRLFLHRNWRSSFIVPFTSNISAILYKCTKYGISQYKVQFLRNEEPLPLKNCPQGFCSWKAFETIVKPIANNCNPKKYCRVLKKS